MLFLENQIQKLEESRSKLGEARSHSGCVRGGEGGPGPGGVAARASGRSPNLGSGVAAGGCEKVAGRAGSVESTSSKKSANSAGALGWALEVRGQRLRGRGFLEPGRSLQVGIPRGESRTHPNSVGTGARSLCAPLGVAQKAPRCQAGAGGYSNVRMWAPGHRIQRTGRYTCGRMRRNGGRCGAWW